MKGDESDHSHEETDHSHGEINHSHEETNHSHEETNQPHGESDHSHGERDHSDEEPDHSLKESDHTCEETEHSSGILDDSIRTDDGGKELASAKEESSISGKQEKIWTLQLLEEQWRKFNIDLMPKVIIEHYYFPN